MLGCEVGVKCGGFFGFVEMIDCMKYCFEIGFCFGGVLLMKIYMGYDLFME